MIDDRRVPVAVFIDIENIMFAKVPKGGSDDDQQVQVVCPDDFVKGVTESVKNVAANPQFLTWRAYTDVSRVRTQWKRMLREAGIELIHVAAAEQYGGHSSEKNAADVALAIDCLSFVADHPGVELVVIVSGDGALAPLAHRLRAQTKTVVVVAVDSALSVHLKGAANEVGYLLVQPATTPGPVSSLIATPAEPFVSVHALAPAQSVKDSGWGPVLKELLGRVDWSVGALSSAELEDAVRRGNPTIHTELRLSSGGMRRQMFNALRRLDYSVFGTPEEFTIGGVRTDTSGSTARKPLAVRGGTVWSSGAADRTSLGTESPEVPDDAVFAMVRTGWID